MDQSPSPSAPEAESEDGPAEERAGVRVAWSEVGVGEVGVSVGVEAAVKCGVCSEVYEAGGREPLVLPCGHTFCCLCLARLGASGSLVCPACRASHIPPAHLLPSPTHPQPRPAAHLPVNYALLRLAEQGLETQVVVQQRGMCSSHKEQLCFWCRRCSVLVCGRCLLPEHLQRGHEVLHAADLAREKQQAIQRRIQHLRAALHTSRRSTRTCLHRCLVTLVRLCRESSNISQLEAELSHISEEAKNLADLDALLVSEAKLRSLCVGVGEGGGGGGGGGDGAEGGGSEAGDAGGEGRECDEVECSVEEDAGVHGTEEEENERESRDSDHDNCLGDANGDNGNTNVVQQCGPETCANDADSIEEDAGVCEGDGCGGVTEGGDTACGEDVAGGGWEWWCGAVVGGEGRCGEVEEDPATNSLLLTALAPRLQEPPLALQVSLLEGLADPGRPLVFLELSVGSRYLGRLTLRLWGHLRRAQHFQALCLGSLGPSFTGSSFEYVGNRNQAGEYLVGGAYLTEDSCWPSPGGKATRGLLEGLEWGGEYSGEEREGLVQGAGGGHPEFDSLFYICTRGDPSGVSQCPFGEVVGGMGAVRAAVRHTVTQEVLITRCGLFLPQP